MLLFLLLSIIQPQTDHTEIVRAAKTLVVLAGTNIDGPDDCGRFQITIRVAKALEADGAGLIMKSAGAGCQIEGTLYDADKIAYKDGTVVDILGGGNEGPNTPHWQIGVAVDPSRWRAPVSIPIPVPAPNNQSEPPKQDQTDTILSRLDQLAYLLDQLRQQQASDTEKLQQQIDQAVKNAEKSGSKLLRLLPLGALGCLAK